MRSCSDPAAGEWLSTGSLTLNGGRSSHTATLLDNGMVLVAGGQTFIQPAEGAELYNPADGTWTSTGNPITPRYDHAAALLRNGNVLVVGGVKSNGLGDELNSAEL